MPARLIAGQRTLLSRTMHDIRYDAVHDEFVVNNPFAHAILVFRGGADGEEAPIRVIQGPSTQLAGTSRLDVDVVNNEIIIPDGDRILVFPREGNGEVAPLRVIHGSDTRLISGGAVAVDPVSNLIVIGTNRGFREGEGDGSLLIYNRTDNGNVPPRRRDRRSEVWHHSDQPDPNLFTQRLDRGEPARARYRPGTGRRFRRHLERE